MPSLSFGCATGVVAHGAGASSSFCGDGGARLGRLAELDLERLLLAEAHDVDVDDVARLEAANDALQRAHLIDRRGRRRRR